MQKYNIKPTTIIARARINKSHALLQACKLPLSVMMLAVLGACGGSGENPIAVAQDTSKAAPKNAVAVSATTTTASTTCYDGGVNNVLSGNDSFYENAWHLKNTGPTQVVSAVNNNGLAGIDANVENVHKDGKGCTGKGVTIAIVDSALEIGHEDLAANVLPGKSWNFVNNTDDPSPPAVQTSTDHGTGVAGVAAAVGWNGRGSRGTAPFASLVAYPTVGVTPMSGTSRSDMDYLSFGARNLADNVQSVVTSFGNRADATSIFNYSAGADYAAPAAIDDFSPFELASKWGTANLRSGLGAIYFQATGNEFSGMTGQLPDGTSMMVNCHSALLTDANALGGELSNVKGMSCGNPNHESRGKPYFYQVASIHNTGKASSYSNSGAANWITGFGGEFGTQEAAIISTDNSGCATGGNSVGNKSDLIAQFGEIAEKLIADLFGAASSKDPNCNYTGRMNGTSSATPSVSGVTALMLEANPKLTWQDVGYILAKTARKVDTTIATGANAVNFTPSMGNGPWNIEDPWIVNSAGFNFQNRYGFGMVDADAAVKLAAKYTPPAGRRSGILSATGEPSTSARVSPTVGVNSSMVTFSNAGEVNGPIRIDLTVTNNSGTDINPGYLQFIVENTTTGTKSIVMPAFTSWYVGGKNFKMLKGAQQKFRFHSNAFYGEPLAGKYKVYIVDFSGASGGAGKALDVQTVITSFSI